MSTRKFIIIAALWAVALLLSATPLGAIVGFFEGIAVAFFVAPLIFLLHVPQSWLTSAVWALGAAYAVWVLVLAVRGLRAWLRGDANGARGWWAGAISLVAIAGVLQLSADALVAAWH